MKRLPRQQNLPRQRGAATLIVVMVLFFMLTMVAAYTSRNLIFEQRTGANQYRATQALEAADAGIEWALAHLNAGRITDACVPSTDDAAASDRSFRERYLTVNPSTGNITFPAISSGGSATPRCVFNGTATDPGAWGWSCSCPQPDAATTQVSSPSAPSFTVRMRRAGALTARQDLFSLESNSCTALNDTCLNFNADRGGSGDGVASVRTVVALRGALTRIPVAALTLAGSLIDLPSPGPTMAVTNTDTLSNGTTIHAAGTIPFTGISLTGLPGTLPNRTAITGDTTLAPATLGTLATADRRFAAFFGMLPDTYKMQPGMVRIDCSGGCSASANVIPALQRNPGRAIWILGPAGTLTIDADIGSAARPALLVVEGDVGFNNGVTLTGMLYGRKPSWTWTTAGPATLRGGIVAEGDLQFDPASAGATALTYDAAVLQALRVSHGTFVRVPGSWQDFQ